MSLKSRLESRQTLATIRANSRLNAMREQMQWKQYCRQVIANCALNEDNCSDNCTVNSCFDDIKHLNGNQNSEQLLSDCNKSQLRQQSDHNLVANKVDTSVLTKHKPDITERINRMQQQLTDSQLFKCLFIDCYLNENNSSTGDNNNQRSMISKKPKIGNKSVVVNNTKSFKKYRKSKGFGDTYSYIDTHVVINGVITGDNKDFNKMKTSEDSKLTDKQIANQLINDMIIEIFVAEMDGVLNQLHH